MIKSQTLLNSIAQALYDKKGANILALDVSSISDLTDYCVIVEGNVERHVKALSKNVIDAAKEQHAVNPYFIEGELESDWIVIDFGDVIVHIMLPEMREKYALEDLWKKGAVVDLEIDVAPVNNNEAFDYEE